MFVAEISDEFFLGLNILHIYDAYMVIGHHMLRLGEEEMSLWRSWAEPWLFLFVAASDRVIHDAK
jgi:hypothetical protein